VKEVDPSSGEVEESGTEDEYQLEDIEITIADFMRKTLVTNFQEKWDEIGDEFEAVETYSLSTMKNLQGKFGLRNPG
jgi:coatomer protein complex subunit gamma